MSGPTASSPDPNENSRLVSIGENTLVDRRRVLTGLIGGISLLAGCSANIGGDGTETPSPTANGTENGEAEEEATSTATETTSTDSDQTEQQPDEDSTDDESTETEAEGGTLELAPLETYTNDSAGFSIDYPAHWTVDDRSDSVEITNDDNGSIQVGVQPRSEYPGSADDIADDIIDEFDSEMSESSLSKEGETTTASGHPAVLVHGSYDPGANDVGMVRITYLVIPTETEVYAAIFAAEEADWSPTVRSEAENILRSLTISDG